MGEWEEDFAAGLKPPFTIFTSPSAPPVAIAKVDTDTLRAALADFDYPEEDLDLPDPPPTARLDLDQHFMEVYRDAWAKCPTEEGEIYGARTKWAINHLIADPTFQAAMAELLVKNQVVTYAPVHQLVEEWDMNDSSLGDVIRRLSLEDPNKVIALGFHNPHSYRGDYADLAFEPATRCRVGDMLATAEQALDQVYEGYKGGEYRMTAYSQVWIANEGSSSGTLLSPTVLELMLRQELYPADQVPAHPYQAENRFHRTCHFPGCSKDKDEH